MFFALGRGVPEARLTSAHAMMLGVGLTLAAAALVSVLACETVVRITTRHGASIQKLGRVLDGMPGAAMIFIAVRELWS
jgi:ABC-type nickel/cobalt efflux system permease component RcnA